MKYIVNLSRFFVGVLFIFSGFIKLDDPIGFSYKLEEYFSAEVLNLPFFEPYVLGISVFVVVFEVVLGVFLLVGYKPKFTVWSLLGMIVFFTFLTFYAAYFDKVKDCGCFGDFLKLTPWQSFTKDVILLVLILVLFFGVRHIKPVFSKLGVTVVALLGFVVSLGFGYYVLMHLPLIDFRAYKVGNNILEEMSIPENAKKPVIEYTWVFNVNGEEKEYVTNGAYPEVDGKYVSVSTKVIEEGYEPKILDFSIESDDEDLTSHFLEEEHLIMIVSYNLLTAEKEGLGKLKAISDEALENGYTVIGLTASGDDDKQYIKDTYHLNFNFYLCDEKVLKTIVRSNPGVLKLEKGTVIQKVHWNDLDQLKLPKVERKEQTFEEREKDNILYLIDGQISSKQEVDNLDKETIKDLNFTIKKEVLDSLNTARNSDYVGFMSVSLKKDSLQ